MSQYVERVIELVGNVSVVLLLKLFGFFYGSWNAFSAGVRITSAP